MNDGGILAHEPAAVVEVLESVYRFKRKVKEMIQKGLDLLCLPDILWPVADLGLFICLRFAG